MAQTVAEAFQSLKIREIEGIIRQKLGEGVNPYSLIKECQDEMAKIGKKFESGEYFLAELIISAKMFEKVVELLSPKLKGKEEGDQKTIGKIILGTPKGDIHDIGKNIFGILAMAAGFEIIDLGIDVPPEKFVEAVRKEQSQIVGMSGLITLVYPSMKEVVDLLKKSGLRQKVKVIIGGGATGEEARRYVGADAQTLDAAEGVRMCKRFVNPSDPGASV
jgi:methylmalonyl-CoA mutase cobalamin-binding domain/chain